MKLRPSRFFKCFHLLRRFREAFAPLFATLSTSLLGETSYFEAPYPESPSQTIIQLSRGWMCGIFIVAAAVSAVHGPAVLFAAPPGGYNNGRLHTSAARRKPRAKLRRKELCL